MRGPATKRGRMCGNRDRPDSTGRPRLQSRRPEDTMDTAAALQVPAVSRYKTWIVWAGRVVTLAPVYILLWSARAKLTHSPWYAREWTRIGWSPDALNGVGAIQVTCIVLYLIPQTAILGTVLLTGYLGGAIAS